MNNLKAIRKKANLSLEHLGMMVGATKGHMWSLESGSSNPSLPMAYRIAKVLGLTVYDIWPDETKIEEQTITIRRVVK